LADEINYTKEAFLNQYNIVSLIGAALFSLISWSLFPLLIAGGLELIYLSAVPSHPRFQRLVRAYLEKISRLRSQEHVDQLLRVLPPEESRKYFMVRNICQVIQDNYTKFTGTSQILLEQLVGKLDGLLHSYLRMLFSLLDHKEYLKVTNQEEMKKEIAALTNELENKPPRVQEIHRKRVSILQRRLEKFEKAKENRQIIDAQMAAIEDILKLARDQSFTMQDPQMISEQLESLVHGVEETETTVREMEAVLGGTRETPLPQHVTMSRTRG